jgi:hypothetical protein
MLQAGKPVQRSGSPSGASAVIGHWALGPGGGTPPLQVEKFILLPIPHSLLPLPPSPTPLFRQAPEKA